MRLYDLKIESKDKLNEATFKSITNIENFISDIKKAYKRKGKVNVEITDINDKGIIEFSIK